MSSAFSSLYLGCPASLPPSLPLPNNSTPKQKTFFLFLGCVHKLLYCSQLQNWLGSSSSNQFHTPLNFPLPGFSLISSYFFPSNDFLSPLHTGSFAYAFLHYLPPSCISSVPTHFLDSSCPLTLPQLPFPILIPFPNQLPKFDPCLSGK